MKQKNSLTVASALLLTLVTLALGYFLLGWIPMFLFAFGFAGGFILWLVFPSHASFSSLKTTYVLTLALFIAHKYEERKWDFFPELSKLTGVTVPETDSVGVYLLYAAAGAWLLIPFLIAKKKEFGYYLAWTFFTSMGVTELAHFFFPFFTRKPYGYFPGMVSVLALAPVAWIGLWILYKHRDDRRHESDGSQNASNDSEGG